MVFSNKVTIFYKPYKLTKSNNLKPLTRVINVTDSPQFFVASLLPDETGKPQFVGWNERSNCPSGSPFDCHGLLGGISPNVN